MNWIQSMNRCTGPAVCKCPITGPHQPSNPRCPRNAPLMDPQRVRELAAKDGVALPLKGQQHE